jgi:hybrid cluster-associated redox disulfide protein
MPWGSMTTFHKDMSIIAALEAHPGARAVFERHGMNCCLCLGASSESVEAGAIMHSVGVDQVLEELNQLVTEAT